MRFTVWLQQYLPFTVLKLTTGRKGPEVLEIALQQYLPFTVLKRAKKVMSK